MMNKRLKSAAEWMAFAIIFTLIATLTTVVIGA
jgi:hypothetical protein